MGTIRAILDSNNNLVNAFDYDVWGYPLESRNLEPVNQRYKFTSKERDKESSTDGNGYDYFGARYYDSRIGRWGGVEPMLETYIQFTPYAYSTLNPLKYLDADGEKLVLGGDVDKSLAYVRSMFYTVDQERVTVDETGLVSFDVSGLDIKSDAAYELLNNLVTSSESILFEVTGKTYGLNRETGEKIETEFSESTSGIENYSKTERNINGGMGSLGLLPKEGYSGQVSLGYGYWTFLGSSEKQPTSNIVFHELAENYFRTVGKQPYMRHNLSGAHQSAKEYATKYKRQVGIPGEAGYVYEKPE